MHIVHWLKNYLNFYKFKYSFEATTRKFNFWKDLKKKLTFLLFNLEIEYFFDGLKV